MSPTSDKRPASSGVLEPPPRGTWGHSGPRGRSAPGAPAGYWDADDEYADGFSDGLWLGEAAASSARSDRSARRPPVARGRFVYPARRWPRRLLIGTNVVVALMLIAAGTVYGYVNWQFSKIHFIGIPSINPAAPPPGAPMTILVVGSDSRAGNTGADAKKFGSGSQVAGQRSDTIMIVHVDPASTTATVMSIPRDLWVPIPGKGYSQRINTTFDTGPDLLVNTIQQNLGITIDHYVEVSFQSFRDVVNAVGGVAEYFPTPARDAYSLLNIPNAGCYTMNGDMALSFVRARHYEYKENGRWVFEAESDLARIKRQQSFIKKMIAKAQGSGLTNPVALNNIIGGVTGNLTLDNGFNRSLLLSLGKRFRNLSPGSLPTATLPTTPAVIGGADVLLLQQPQAQQAVSDFLNSARSAPTTSTTDNLSSGLLPSSVRVSVLNGSGRAGEATKAATDLSRQGFVVNPSPHSANDFNYTSSVIRYLPGNEAKAQLVARAVRGSTQLLADPNIQGADVEVVTGSSYQGIVALPGAGGGTTATSGAGPATTVPATPPTTYELPGTPAGFVPPPC